MRKNLTTALQLLIAALLFSGCASHPKDFIPNGSGVSLAPTNPDQVQVLDSIPRGMIIGTVLVDRAKAKNTQEIIAMARQKAAAVGGDFIVWEDSLGTLPQPTPEPGAPAPPSSSSGDLGHSTSYMAGPAPEETAEKTPKARFTVGIFISGH